MGDASSEMSKVIAKAVAFFIYIVFSYIRVSDFRIPLYLFRYFRDPFHAGVRRSFGQPYRQDGRADRKGTVNELGRV